MMKKMNYLKDTKSFWEARRKAREELDKKRANAPISEKVAIVQKLNEDRQLLKKARSVKSPSDR